MYPFIRFALAVAKARKQPRLAMGQPHVSTHICMPWDLDLWKELNNGRTLTLYDLGRFPLFIRSGMLGAMRRRGWTGAVAGCSVRYRKRVRGFDRITMTSAILGWDARFVYINQTMWKGQDATSNALYRVAVTDHNGIVATAEIAAEIGVDPTSPPLPNWVQAWIDAEAQRQWPPDQMDKLLA